VGGSGNKKGPVGASCAIAGLADHIRSVDGARITRISVLIAVDSHSKSCAENIGAE